jgi:hypothetical protein
MSPPRLFSVRICFDADEGPEVADALAGVLRNDGPFLAPGPVTIRSNDGHVIVEFHAISDDPGVGPTSVGQSVPGAEAVAALEGFSHEHSVAAPVMRALLTVTAAREIAGLPPRREIRIDVTPAPPLPQDALSSHLSESVHMTARTFGES